MPNPHTIYVQATSQGVNARASEPFPNAISFVLSIKIVCRTTDLRVVLTEVPPEGAILVAYKNLESAGKDFRDCAAVLFD